MLGPPLSQDRGEDDSRESKRSKHGELVHVEAPSSEQVELQSAASTFRISVVTMAGATIVIDDASAADTIQSVKERIFALNRKLYVRRQRLVYSAGPHGIDPLANEETLGGAGVAQDGSAKLDVLLADLTAADAAELGPLLLDAAWTGRANDMLELLDEGVAVEYKDGRGNSALLRAAEAGHADCVRLLLEIGSGKDVKLDYATALICAATGGHADCVRLLVEDKAATSPNQGMALLQAAVRGHSECVRLLVEAVAVNDMRIVNTTMCLTAGKGHIDCVRWLLKGGADMDAKPISGRSALFWAVAKGRSDCVRLLLESGADKDAKDAGGRTALMDAVRGGHTACVRLLVDGGADKNATDGQGLTALAHARAEGHSAIVDLLTASDASVSSLSSAALST